ncbi:hypothetical protein ELI_2994 [Eubacterium callanderi]|uniref:Uncharacterized protein n=1 Tax=Eubacterium callanderi TaxID=53442 RepID=E3GEH7_9FIRM|nr:hypothetical protein ELI_2994 [Eubacterium callanderi]
MDFVCCGGFYFYLFDRREGEEKC